MRSCDLILFISPMKLQEQLKKYQDAIKTLEACEERYTESFRIVINSLRQKEAEIKKRIANL